MHLRNALTMALMVASALCAGCAGTASQPTNLALDPNAIIGTMPGKGNFENGNGTYTIDVDLPPGKRDVQPSFKIRYSSHNTDGVIGLGWDAIVKSYVSRCRATHAQDGYSATVQFTSTDRLCFNGEHLLLLSGVYGKSGSVYTPELDTLTRVQLFGDLDSPSSYFVATDSDGGKFECRSALIPAGLDKPLEWDETLFVTRSGNTVERDYDRSLPGESLLTDITYTGTYANGVLTRGTRKITFNYTPRPDPSSFYVAGGEVRQTRRLASMAISVPGTAPGNAPVTIREYDFTYAQSSATGRSLVTAIQECAFESSGAKKCLPATHFNWSGETPVFEAPTKYAVPQLDANLNPVQMLDATSEESPPYVATGDFDGDGHRELLYYRPGVGAHLYFMNTDGTVRKDVDVSSFFQSKGGDWHRAYSADMDGDGADDLPGNVNGHLGFASWNGTDMNPPIATDIPYQPEMFLVDADGDGRTDVLQTEPVSPGSKDYALYLYRNLDSSPGNYRFGKRELIAPISEGKSGRRYSVVVLGDLDGSGFPDFALMSDSKIEKIIELSDNADGTLHTTITTTERVGLGDHPFLFADINGDGLEDVVFSQADGNGKPTWRYQLNTGGHFAPAIDTHVTDDRPTGIGKTGMLVLDMDGDGTEELLYPDQLVTPFCIGGAYRVAGNYKPENYQCSHELDQADPWEDLGVYRYTSMKFTRGPDGALVPTVNHDTGVVAQANLATVGQLRGDGLPDIISPFTPWLANGHFRSDGGEYLSCPPDLGCGLRVSILHNADHEFSVNSAPDLLTSAMNGLGMKYLWDYYPLSSGKPGLYATKPVGTPGRYIDAHQFDYTPSMYVVGGYAESSGVKDGFLAYAGQYGDLSYRSDGRGVVGYRWMITTDKSAEVRTVALYNQKYPLDGLLTKEWKEHTELTGDDVPAGKADPGHGYTLDQDWGCTAPAGSNAQTSLGCVTGNGPTYSYRLLHKVEHEYDDKLQSWLDTDSTFTYDKYGNELTNDSKAVDSSKTVTTQIANTYALPDPGAWIFNSQSSQKKTVTTATRGKDGTPDKTITKTELHEYQYNGDGQEYGETIHDERPDKEVRKIVFQQDATSHFYKEPVSISISMLNKDDGTVDNLNTVHLKYSDDGYYVLAYTSGNGDTVTQTFDPLTGKQTGETKDKETTTLQFDLFGRLIRQDVTKDGNPPVITHITYLPCDRYCMPNAIYYKEVDVEGTPGHPGYTQYIHYNVRDVALDDSN